MTDIMKLADDYVDKVARGKSGTQKARAALQSAIKALQGERDAIEKNAINQVDDLHKAWAERDALAAKLDELTKQEPVKWAPEEIEDGMRGIRWVMPEGVFGRPTDHDVREYLLRTETACGCQCDDCKKFYAAPKALAPLTDDAKRAMWVAATIELPSQENCYLSGIADAEHSHGITKGTP